MSLRTVVHNGTVWTVWDVVRTLSRSISVPLPDGASPSWLCFQSSGEKRRLVPAPQGWERWSDEQIVVAMQDAPVVAPGATLPLVTTPGGPAETDQDRQHRFAATMERARELDARVRRAMTEGGAKALHGSDIPDPLPDPS